VKWRRIFHTASIGIALVAIAIVVGAVYLDVQDTSPGPLATVHVREPRLASSQNCTLCHGSDSQSMTSACLDCHADIDAQLNQPAGFHGRLEPTQARDCGQCHSEHHGPDFVLTNSRSFQLAGIDDPHKYDHAGLDFRLSGKHLDTTCDACHKLAFASILPEGAKRFLGLGQQCMSCHDDVHRGTYGQDCASCHGQEHPFTQVAEFKHTEAFQLVGGHGKSKCVDCHPKDTQHAVDRLLAIGHPVVADTVTLRTCADCHASPHKQSFLARVGRRLDLEVGRSCEHCHPATHNTFLGPLATIDVALHAESGFALTPPHDKVACEACHEGYGGPKTRLVSFTSPGSAGDANDCKSCHGDPHRGQFDHGPFAGQSCLVCHEPHAFVPSSFTAAQHDQIDFALRGAHQHVACNDCHRLDVSVAPVTTGPKPVSARIYRGTPSSCRACHRDPHRGDFDAGPFRGADCQTCHDEHSFRHPTFGFEQHGQTRFPLTGAHQAVGCNACHPRDGSAVNSPSATLAGDATGPRKFHGAPADCAACHEDIHKGVFDRRGLPAMLDGKQGCARCHTTNSFSEVHADTFDHGRWTGYPLRGAHARAACRDCHVPDRADPYGSAFGRTINRACQSCHTDPHLGQFGDTAQVDCSRCHLEGDRFSELSFDHQTDSRYPLDEVHIKLECSKCHQRQRLQSGREAVRYKPLGTDCGDCHVARGPRTTSNRP
jgi:hypothetical protein